MSGIDRIKEKMKQKIAFAELPIQPKVNEKGGRKIYSLTQVDNARLKKLFSRRLNLEQGTSIAELMSEAIELLYQREFS